jgi:hypothetical protein
MVGDKELVLRTKVQERINMDVFSRVLLPRKVFGPLRCSRVRLG